MTSPQENSDLCRDAFARLIAERAHELGELGDPERTVILVGRLIDVLEHLEETARALRRIDADSVAAAFEENQPGRDAAVLQIKACLAEYIRDHVQTLEVMDELPLAEIVEADAEPKPRTLPHWAGVAFAAHCARGVFPLLSKYWPLMPMERAARIRVAIEMAAASAAQAKPQPELNFLVVEMMAVAGAALVGASGIAPPDARSGTLASFIAKTAEKAVDAARTPPGKSAPLTREAFAFAEQAASEAPDLVRQLKRDRRLLMRVAAKRAWNDDEPLSSEELESLLSRQTNRPWWKMW